MKNQNSTSYISPSSSNQSSLNRVQGDGSADLNKAGFYFRDSSFLIDEYLNFIVTEGDAKFILDFIGDRTVDVEGEITDTENIK